MAIYENTQDGYIGFGLFQIRGSDWCGDHGRNRCHMSCSGKSLFPFCVGALEAVMLYQRPAFQMARVYKVYKEEGVAGVISSMGPWEAEHCTAEGTVRSGYVESGRLT